MKGNRKKQCTTCSGSGSQTGKTYKCEECKGKGIKIIIRQLGPGMIQQMRAQCNICNGKKYSINKNDLCNKCDGAKILNEKLSG